MADTVFVRPISSRRASLKKAEVSGSSMAIPMRTRWSGAVLAGIGRRTRRFLSSQSNSVGLPRRQERSHRLARELQNGLARLRGGELHGQNAVFVFHGEQLRGGVDHVLGAGEIGALAAQAVGPSETSSGSHSDSPGRHGHAGNRQRRAGSRHQHAQVVVERLIARGW